MWTWHDGVTLGFWFTIGGSVATLFTLVALRIVTSLFDCILAWLKTEVPPSTNDEP
jgi:hypothetical protein